MRLSGKKSLIKNVGEEEYNLDEIKNNLSKYASAKNKKAPLKNIIPLYSVNVYISLVLK